MEKKYLLAAISICISIISYITLLVGLLTIKFLNPIAILLISLISLIVLIITVITYFSKKKSIYNIGVFVSFLLNIILVYNIYIINNEYSFIKNVINHEYKYTTYNVYVQKKNTAYNNIEKLNGKKIGLLVTNKKNVEESIKNIVAINCITYYSTQDLISAMETGEIQSFILSEEEYKIIEKENNHIKYQTHIIYTSKIKDTNK